MSNLKLLYIDIETCPNIVLNWRTGYDISIPTEFILKEREILCIGYKWGGGHKVTNLFRKPGISEKDILRKFAKITEKADVVIGHNGDNFDVKWLKTRAMALGLKPLPDHKTIDTLKLARSNFALNSNKLGYLADILHIGHKLETGGISLWKGYMRGDPKAIKKMVTYCNNDVVLLEKVFKKMAPHIKALPINRGIFEKGTVLACPNCASTGTIKKGFRYTATKKYQERQCSRCATRFKSEYVR